MRCSGARQAGDDDRRYELDLGDLGMATEQVDEQQSVLQELEQLRVQVEQAGRGQVELVHRSEQHVETLGVVARSEVPHAGLFARELVQLLGLQLQAISHRNHNIED